MYLFCIVTLWVCDVVTYLDRYIGMYLLRE